MNLKDAISSGRPFKREKWSDVYWLIEDGNEFLFYQNNNLKKTLKAEDMISDDWVIYSSTDQKKIETA